MSQQTNTDPEDAPKGPDYGKYRDIWETRPSAFRPLAEFAGRLTPAGLAILGSVGALSYIATKLLCADVETPTLGYVSAMAVAVMVFAIGVVATVRGIRGKNTQERSKTSPESGDGRTGSRSDGKPP